MIIRCLSCMEMFDDRYTVCPHCGYACSEDDREAVHLPLGVVLNNRYIVGRVLGYGGFGATYIAWDGKLEQKVAIKEYLPSEFSTRMPGQSRITVFEGDKHEQYNDGLEKFVDEAKRLAKFQNENGIVKIYDTFKENDTAYIVMEYLDGETLAEYLKENGVIEEDRAVEMLMPVMRSLETVHEAGLIHRDIAPDNIFITKTGEIKLIDFGAARYATTSHSRSLTVIIKPGYSPEEQYRSMGDQGPHTDVYALAATLYKMITGQTPPDAMERRAQYESKSRDILPEPHKLNKNISVNRENALLNAMNVRIEDRTPTVTAFIRELESETPAKRVYGKIKKIDLYNWPLWAKIGIPALLACLAAFGVLLLTGVINFSKYTTKMEIPENIAIAPDVEGMNKDEAIRIIEDNTLLASTSGTVQSEYIPAGTIIIQQPVGGTFIQKNGTVSLTVSSGSGVIEVVDGIATVPYVIWDTEEDAIAKLLEAGLASPEIEYVYDDNVSAGQVISTDPAAGTELPEGSAIKMVVSLGAEAFEMPDVIGKQEQAARDELESKGLVISVSYEKDSSVPEGQVISQSIDAGSNVQRGDEVLLTVSSGKPTIVVADVVGKQKADAEKTLKEQGFKVNVLENYSDTVPAGQVISQDPKAGTSLVEGGTVTVWISKGKQAVSVASISLNKKTMALITGKSESLTATVLPANATNKAVAWASSNTKVAKVDSKGKVTAVSAGEAVITATTADGGKKASCTVTVTNATISVTGVELNVNNLNMNVGNTTTLKATVKPSNATNKNVTWKSGNTSVATVDASGKVTAKAAGETTITVTTVDGGKTATCKVKVSVPVINVTGVTLDRTSATLTVGSTLALKATVKPSNATNNKVTWKSSNIGVATVDSSGKVTAKAAGETTITVTTVDGGYKATCTVTVNVPVTGVTLNIGSLNLTVGSTSTLTATVKPSNATNKSVTWKSSNIGVATVDSKGKVTAKAAGSTTITVTTVDGGYTATCSVTVKPQQFTVTFNANGGSVSPSSMTATVGQALGALPTPTRTGHSFTGWFTSASGGTQITSNTVYNTANNITIYAHWNVSTVTVPNFSGQSLNAAITWCNNNGVGYSTNYGYMWNYDNNVVVSNSNANGQVTVGSSITLNVSRGPKPIAVGDYVYVSGYCYSNSGGGTQGKYLNGYYYIVRIYKYGEVWYPFCVSTNMDIANAPGWVSESSVHQRSGNAWGGKNFDEKSNISMRLRQMRNTSR